MRTCACKITSIDEQEREKSSRSEIFSVVYTEQRHHRQNSESFSFNTPRFLLLFMSSLYLNFHILLVYFLIFHIYLVYLSISLTRLLSICVIPQGCQVGYSYRFVNARDFVTKYTVSCRPVLHCTPGGVECIV